MRGLKFTNLFHFHYLSAVAPYMGAWIEIILPHIILYLILVAPYMGAWIEIWLEVERADEGLVAPYMGAWIEILNLVKSPVTRLMSHLHGCVD